MRTKLTATTVMFFLAIWLSLIFSCPVNAAISGGKFGNALEFDGIDDYVMVPDSSSLRMPSTEITIEAWMYIPSNSTEIQYIMRKWSNADGGWFSYTLACGGNTISGGVGNKDLGQYPVWGTTQTIADLGIADTWAHIAFTWKKDAITGADGRIFVNGVSVATTFTPYGYSNTFAIGYDNYPLYLARKVDAAWSNTYFKGGLDEIRISNIARTSFNLTALPSVDTNTVALWRFDEGAGLTTNDASAKGNNGTISGATWTGVVVPEFSSPIVLLLSVIGVSLLIILVRKHVKR